MINFITQYWIEAIFSGLIAILVGALRIMYGKIKRLELVENGMQALLRDRIIQSYNNHMEKGFCPIYALESINYMYNQYHALGGNGTVTKLIEELKRLPVQNKDGEKYDC